MMSAVFANSVDWEGRKRYALGSLPLMLSDSTKLGHLPRDQWSCERVILPQLWDRTECSTGADLDGFQL